MILQCGHFSRMLKCRTPALDAEVYSSGGKEYSFCHPCKSRSCPSCGWRATLIWQEELPASLPDIPYSGICFTMSKTLWPIFRNNRRLLHDLPSLAAEVIQEWAQKEFGARVIIVVIPHTFLGQKIRHQPDSFLSLGQEKRSRPTRLGWQDSIRKCFGRDPLP